MTMALYEKYKRAENHLQHSYPSIAFLAIKNLINRQHKNNNSIGDEVSNESERKHTRNRSQHHCHPRKSISPTIRLTSQATIIFNSPLLVKSWDIFFIFNIT